MADIPKIVGQRLRTVVTPKEHPDPNLLSAFLERSLGRRESVQVVEHLSQCTNCREIVSLSAVRPVDADAPLIVPDTPRWFSWPILRWGAAVACVVVVGAAVMIRQQHGSRQFAATAAEKKPAPVMALPARSDALQSREYVASATRTAVAVKPAPKSILANPSHAANSQPTEMAEARTASSIADLVPGRAKDALSETQPAKSMGAFARKKSMVADAGDAFVPGNVVPRWTLSADGTLQRSLNSGRTWQNIPVASQTIFRALAANGLDIWVGGASGALFHSADAGQHWTQVRPAVNGEALSDDIIGVEFRDAQHGKLTSSNDETWITADAGQSWQKQ